jgi:hypothetical protein
MAGSLLDNEDFSSIGSGGGSKGGGSRDNGNMIKIGVIVVCLGGAGLLFAYQAGLIFGSKGPVDNRTQQQIDEEEQQFQKQERVREKLKTLPEYQQGDA